MTALESFSQVLDRDTKILHFFQVPAETAESNEGSKRPIPLADRYCLL